MKDWAGEAVNLIANDIIARRGIDYAYTLEKPEIPEKVKREWRRIIQASFNLYGPKIVQL